MSKIRTAVKVVTVASALIGTARYLSDANNRQTVRNGALVVGQTVANVAGKVTNVAAAAKDRVAARVG